MSTESLRKSIKSPDFHVSPVPHRDDYSSGHSNDSLRVPVGRARESNGTHVQRPAEWPAWTRALVVFQVVSHASMASWCASAFIPAFYQMSIEFDTSIGQITYLVGAYTLFMGFGVLLWNPLSESLGRRPIMLFSLLVTVCASCGAAVANTYGTIMIARVFQGLGVCAALSLGVSYLKEMYAPAQRGRVIGLWTLGITSGPFVAPFVGGFIATYYNWRFILWLEAILLAALLILETLLLPESLVSAPGYRAIPSTPSSSAFRAMLLQPTWRARGGNVGKGMEGAPKPADSIVKTLRACFYAPVWVMGLGFAVPYGYVSVSLSALFPIVYGQIYAFSPAIQGVLYLPMLVGSVLAEAVAGMVGDWVVNRGGKDESIDDNEESSEERRPERRLVLAHVGSVITIVGLVWFGVSVQRRENWAVPAIGTGVAAFGVQMLTSVSFSYVVDLYPKSAKEVVTLLNIFRVLSSFVVLFYNQLLINALGWGWGFGVQAFITGVFSLGGIVGLELYRGRERARG